ncbi:hypothetical protein CRG98_006921 [Punica granatum]|uniref:Uncharacterized protein n=1 Tax=Punica granatum TaxID=22663 RepID=A0A2I0KWF1_PUNGR|nr:hypothetical protein CRG98_006921 [Punica granatum]
MGNKQDLYLANKSGGWEVGGPRQPPNTPADSRSHNGGRRPAQTKLTISIKGSTAVKGTPDPSNFGDPNNGISQIEWGSGVPPPAIDPLIEVVGRLKSSWRTRLRGQRPARAPLTPQFGESQWRDP